MARVLGASRGGAVDIMSEVRDGVALPAAATSDNDQHGYRESRECQPEPRWAGQYSPPFSAPPFRVSDLFRPRDLRESWHHSMILSVVCSWPLSEVIPFRNGTTICLRGLQRSGDS